MNLLDTISKNTKVFQTKETPLRSKDLSFEKRWNGEDKGLITAYEIGRRDAQENKKRADTEDNLSDYVKSGGLPILPFKGGHAKNLDSIDFKWGTFTYLANIQGLREDDLDIDFERDEGLEKVCSFTNMKTKFTSDIENLK